MSDTKRVKLKSAIPKLLSAAKKMTKYLIGFPVILLVSCNNEANTIQGNQESSIKRTSNVIKVLDRVKCNVSNVPGFLIPICTQEDFDQIWQACLNDGFTTKLPSQQIASSRAIEELTSDRILISTNSPKQLIDENGVVYESETEVDTTQKEITVSGFCIGSEYITR